MVEAAVHGVTIKLQRSTVQSILYIYLDIIVHVQNLGWITRNANGPKYDQLIWSIYTVHCHL